MMPAGQPIVLGNAQTPMVIGQATIGIINGPNGPQYVILDGMPGTISMPASSPVIPVSPPPIVSTPTLTAPQNVPAPIVEANYSPPTGQPTFSPPAPASVPIPAMPQLPGAVEPPKLPEFAPAGALPKSPSGPTLPAASDNKAGLGAYPTPPMAAPNSAPMLPKLPPATGPVEDDIPAAPIFLPVGK